jgi:prephenate dehydratase
MALKGKIEDMWKCIPSDGCLQCMDFFLKISNIKLVEDKDTAETARRIQENN